MHFSRLQGVLAFLTKFPRFHRRSTANPIKFSLRVNRCTASDINDFGGFEGTN